MYYVFYTKCGLGINRLRKNLQMVSLNIHAYRLLIIMHRFGFNETRELLS